MNDFIDDLLSCLNDLNQPIKTHHGYLMPGENAAIYPLPGGTKTYEDMAGNEETTLNYEYALQSKDQQAISNQLWAVAQYIDRFNNSDELPIEKPAYTLQTMKVTSTPNLSGTDEQGYTVGLIDFQAIIGQKG